MWRSASAHHAETVRERQHSDRVLHLVHGWGFRVSEKPLRRSLHDDPDDFLVWVHFRNASPCIVALDLQKALNRRLHEGTVDRVHLIPSGELLAPATAELARWKGSLGVKSAPLLALLQSWKLRARQDTIHAWNLACSHCRPSATDGPATRASSRPAPSDDEDDDDDHSDHASPDLFMNALTLRDCWDSYDAECSAAAVERERGEERAAQSLVDLHQAVSEIQRERREDDEYHEQRVNGLHHDAGSQSEDEDAEDDTPLLTYDDAWATYFEEQGVDPADYAEHFEPTADNYGPDDGHDLEEGYPGDAFGY